MYMEMKLYKHDAGHMTKLSLCPYLVKSLQNSSSLEPVDRFARNLVCSIGDSTIIVSSNDDLGLL